MKVFWRKYSPLLVQAKEMFLCVWPEALVALIVTTWKSCADDAGEEEEEEEEEEGDEDEAGDVDFLG